MVLPHDGYVINEKEKGGERAKEPQRARESGRENNGSVGRMERMDDSVRVWVCRCVCVCGGSAGDYGRVFF